MIVLDFLFCVHNSLIHSSNEYYYHGLSGHQPNTILCVWSFISVSQALRENTYPFLAMIMLKDRKMTVVGRLEGLVQPEDLINQLNFIMEANQTYLVSERLER